MVVIFTLKEFMDLLGIKDVFFLVPTIVSFVLTWIVAQISYEVIESPFLGIKSKID